MSAHQYRFGNQIISLAKLGSGPLVGERFLDHQIIMKEVSKKIKNDKLKEKRNRAAIDKQVKEIFRDLRRKCPNITSIA